MPDSDDTLDRPATVARPLLRWAPVAAWMAVIFAASSLPGSSVPGGWSVQGHLAEYAVLGALLVLALRVPGRGRLALLLAAIALGSAYGVTDELHQAFVPGRTPDVLDWAADTLGAAAGATLAVTWLAAVARRR